MKEVLILVAIFVVIIGMANCNSEPEKVGTKTLPDGTVVEHYQFMQNGSLHHIYKAKDATVTTDNQTKRQPVITIEKP